MKISVRIKDVKIVCNDFDTTGIIKQDSYNKQLQETIKVMSDECLKLHKECK